jgi:hypothetical protein
MRRLGEKGRDERKEIEGREGRVEDRSEEEYSIRYNI